MKTAAWLVLVASFSSALWYACTLKVDAPVPQPKITIGCVIIELPGGGQVRSCDGGTSD